MNALPLRLPPGCDLRRDIERAVAALPERSGFVLSGIGSLSHASVRFAAAQDATALVESLEVLSLAGSITPEGAHLHASLSSASGRVFGGHLGYGCLVRTTAEVLIAVLPEWRLSRSHDPASGDKELTIAQRENGDGASPADAFAPPPRSDARPLPSDASDVTLQEITAETVRSIIALSVAEDQKGFVAPNATSLAQALFAPEAWYRAICRSGEFVGFVMVEDESLRLPPPPNPKIGVWRLMIDAKFQRQGLGRAALLKVIEHARGKGFRTLELSYVPGPGCPEPFYLGLGFRHTGRVDGQEVVLELPLGQSA